MPWTPPVICERCRMGSVENGRCIVCGSDGKAPPPPAPPAPPAARRETFVVHGAPIEIDGTMHPVGATVLVDPSDPAMSREIYGGHGRLRRPPPPPPPPRSPAGVYRVCQRIAIGPDILPPGCLVQFENGGAEHYGDAVARVDLRELLAAEQAAQPEGKH